MLDFQSAKLKPTHFKWVVVYFNGTPYKFGCLAYDLKSFQYKELAYDDILALSKFVEVHMGIFLNDLGRKRSGIISHKLADELDGLGLLVGVPRVVCVDKGICIYKIFHAFSLDRSYMRSLVNLNSSGDRPGNCLARSANSSARDAFFSRAKEAQISSYKIIEACVLLFCKMSGLLDEFLIC